MLHDSTSFKFKFQSLKYKLTIAVIIFFPIYLAIVLLSDISFCGFWTDVFFSVYFSVFALKQSFKNKFNFLLLTWTLRITNIASTIVVFGLLFYFLSNPFSWDVFKLRSFYFQQVDGRVFNAYFKPVGAYSGGYGNFWISETPMYFPIIEWRVYWDRTVHHDFNDDTFDGEPIDNYEVVKRYIRDHVLSPQNEN
jgi:hypothetical protein